MFTGKSQSNKLAFSFALLDQKRVKCLETLILSCFYKNLDTILDTKLQKNTYLQQGANRHKWRKIRQNVV